MELPPLQKDERPVGAGRAMFGFALEKELSQTFFHHRIGVSLVDVGGKEFQVPPSTCPGSCSGSSGCLGG